MELVTRFPPSEVVNLPVWQNILLRPLSQDVRHCVETDIIGLAQKVLTDWQNGGHKLGQLDNMVRTTSAMGCSRGVNRRLMSNFCSRKRLCKDKTSAFCFFNY